MLALLSRFFGFDLPGPPPRPKRRTQRPSVAPAPARSNGTTTIPPWSPRAITMTKPNTTAEAVVCIDKVHGLSSADRNYTAGPPGPVDAKAKAVLGPELHSYCRALLLTGSKLPVVPRPLETDAAFNARLRDNLETDSLADIDTWERAMDEIGRRRKAAARAGLPLPDLLTVPEAVLQAIATRQAERAERLDRMSGGRGGGKGGTARPHGEPASENSDSEVEHAASLKGGGGKKRKREDEESEGGFEPPTPAPLGPRR